MPLAFPSSPPLAAAQRRSPANAEDRLHPSDNLLIVRVGKHLDDTDKWKIGGAAAGLDQQQAACRAWD